MLFKEAITLRILELCNKYNYTPNKLAELSAIAPSTLRALLANNVDIQVLQLSLNYVKL